MIAEKPTENQSELLRMGVSLGHRVASRHPKMKNNLSGIKAGFDIIDEAKTQESLDRAKAFIKEAVISGKTILVVGTKVQAKDLVKEFATTCAMPFINVRWLGGTISNFEVIKRRISHLKSIEAKKADGSIAKYTKKEQGKMDKELVKLIEKYGGIKFMDRLPDVLLVMDMKKDFYAIKEANEANIPVIAIADTNVDPTKAQYPIYASDDVVESIQYVVNALREVILSAKGQAK